MEKFYNENYDRLVPPGDGKSRIGLPRAVEALIEELNLHENWQLVNWEVSGDEAAVEIRLVWKGGKSEQKKTCCIKYASGEGSWDDIEVTEPGFG